MRRLRDGEWVAGAGAVALLASLFLHWYGIEVVVADAAPVRAEATGWQAFSVIDVLLTALMLVPLALVVLQATRESPSLPVAFSVLTVLAGALASLLILYRIVNQPGPNYLVDVQAGAWLALGAALVTTAGGWRSTRTEDVPAAGLPPVEDLPTPAP